MAYPIIIVDSGGSDTSYYSGAGPGDGVNSGSVVTGVAGANSAYCPHVSSIISFADTSITSQFADVSVTGSHSIYVHNTTGGTRRWCRILGKGETYTGTCDTNLASPTTITNSSSTTVNTYSYVSISGAGAGEDILFTWVTAGTSGTTTFTINDAVQATIVGASFFRHAYIAVSETLGVFTNLNWGIGGTLKTIDHATTRLLFSQDATGLWEVKLNYDQSLTSALAMTYTTGSGFLVIKSNSTTRRTITQTAAAAHFTCSTVNRLETRYLNFLNSNGSPGVVFSTSVGVVIFINKCVIGANDGVNCPLGCVIRTADIPIISAVDSAFLRTTGNCFGNNLNSMFMTGCEVSRCGGDGITVSGASPAFIIEDSIFSYNAGDGIDVAGTSNVTIKNCTFHGNTNNGLRLTSANVSPRVKVINNIFSENGNYGINCDHATSPHLPFVEYNDFYTNTSGTVNGMIAGLSGTNLTLDPQFVDKTNTVRNFEIGTNLKAAGFSPTTETLALGLSGAKTYVDIGAAQRQEAGGGENAFAY